MKILKTTFILAATIGLGACSSSNIVSRAISPDGPLLGAQSAPVISRSYQVVAVHVEAPRALVVSEANSYFPRADIVWRGDTRGDRYAQIETLMQDAFQSGVSGMQGARKVVLNIELARFHGLTEKTRYSIGGTHDIDFFITVTDATTGEVIEQKRFIDTELNALGGDEALNAEAAGQTQKVRIQAHLQQLIQYELRS